MTNSPYISFAGLKDLAGRMNLIACKPPGKFDAGALVVQKKLPLEQQKTPLGFRTRRGQWMYVGAV